MRTTLIHHSRPDGSRLAREECPGYRAVRRGPTRREVDDLFWRRDGSALTVVYTLAPLRDDGQRVGAIGVFADESERRRDAELLRIRTAQQAVLAGLGLRAPGGGALRALLHHASAMVARMLNADFSELLELTDEQHVCCWWPASVASWNGRRGTRRARMRLARGVRLGLRSMVVKDPRPRLRRAASWRRSRSPPTFTRGAAGSTDLYVEPEASRVRDWLIASLAHELMSNMAQHAQARHVTITPRRERDDILFGVAADGRGMDPVRPGEALNQGHVGVASIAMRAESCGGRFRLTTSPGAGRHVRPALAADARNDRRSQGRRPRRGSRRHPSST